MNGHRRVRLLLYDYVRGTLGDDEARMVERHLAGCVACAREAASHRRLLSAVPGPSRRPSDALPDSYWTGFANEVMGKIDAAPARKPGFAGRLFGFSGAFTGVTGFLRLTGPAGRAAAGLAAAMAVAAAVWFILPERDGDRTGAVADRAELSVEDAPSRGREEDGGGIADSGADRASEFDRRLSDYFRKSKTLLVGVSNIGPTGGGVIDLEAERRLSRSLLREARYLRAGPVDPRSSRLLDDLDRVLIGLANGEPSASSPDIEVIRRGIQSENLLFKLRMQENGATGLIVRQASYQRKGAE